MPFKKTNEGWEYDPKGTARIPTKQGLFDRPIPPVVRYDGETGYPLLPDGRIDWKQAVKETKNENS